jgi:hypothetical protein
LFDTRTGDGVRAGKVRHLEPLAVQVAGRAGVPPTGATAVVMNLTVTEPESPGFMRTTPAGEPKASTSNVNFFRGDTVPNLVICKLGANGQIEVDGVGEGAHVLGDVFGYFGPTGNRLRAVPPRRVLDTRIGFGAPKRAVGPGTGVQLPIVGRANVPGDATAVVLNVTATNVSGPTFVTVFPHGEAPPATSNLNVVPRQTVANLVICRLGWAGNLQVHSPVAACDVIADVLGYFVA